MSARSANVEVGTNTDVQAEVKSKLGLYYIQLEQTLGTEVKQKKEKKETKEHTTQVTSQNTNEQE